ncbi:MAG: type II secretion system protein GspD, partial [Methylovulum sp.]
DIESWVLRLDKAQSGTGGGVNVYKVQHADAEELADTLNEIFTGAQKQDRSAKVAAGKKASEISNKSTDSKTDTKSSSSSSKRSSSRTKSAGGTGTAAVADVEDVRIISDKANNALIIVATPREYDVILPVIKQLDLLPLQVLIDATIVSVSLTDELQYGIAWYLKKEASAVGSGLGGAAVLGTMGQKAVAATSAVATGGLSALYNSGSINALLSAQATNNKVNVISSPSLMVLNNQQATIEVGDQIPILTSSLSTAVGSGTNGIAQSNSIQYTDTGVKLEVTPRVNANGMVIMEINQSVSSPKKTTVSNIESATIEKKEINSSVAVHDGETIVLGGLIDDNNAANKGGIPWLHQLPWIGPLFGSTDNSRIKKELVVLITPRVVKSKQDSRLISSEFKRKLTGIYR